MVKRLTKDIERKKSAIADFVSRQSTSFASVAVFASFGAFGWLLDFGLFATLTTIMSLGAGLANFISSMAGALIAFSGYALSRWGGGSAPSPMQLAIYAVYQVAAIILFSAAIAAITNFIRGAEFSLAEWVAAPLAAKILITPLNFATNFTASQLLLKRRRAI